ncbi:hypothetical protein D3C78_1817680 [compost metagenome]
MVVNHCWLTVAAMMPSAWPTCASMFLTCCACANTAASWVNPEKVFMAVAGMMIMMNTP